MATFADVAVELLKHAIPIMTVSEMMTISGCTVLFYDYFLTLPDEVELIWKARPSTISYIFLVNRYTIPLMMIIDIYDRLGLASNPTVLFCRIWVWLEAYLTVFSFMSMHALVAMRVHALHGGSKRLKVVLWVCGVLYAVTTCVILGFALHSKNHELAPAPFFHSCYEDVASYLWTVWVPSLFYECLLFILTISKAIYEARRNIYSPISTILYRDGILYFISISICSMFCMFVWLIAPPMWGGLAKYWATAMVNVAGSRLVLSLKSHARAMQLVPSGSTFGGGVGVSRYSLRFAHTAATGTDSTASSHSPRTPRSFRTHALRPSSSFVVGQSEFEDYIKLEELHSGNSDSFQIGTVYPEKYQTHWEAL